MGQLLRQDIPMIAKLLNSTLDFSDLESFVQASTGDELYDAFVDRHQPKVEEIEILDKDGNRHWSPGRSKTRSGTRLLEKVVGSICA